MAGAQKAISGKSMKMMDTGVAGVERFWLPLSEGLRSQGSSSVGLVQGGPRKCHKSPVSLWEKMWENMGNCFNMSLL